MKIQILILLFILIASVSAEEELVCYKINKTINSCNINISISSDKDSYLANEKITILNNLTENNNFTIEYWIEDNNSNIIKPKLNTTNLNYKQYTPKLNFSQYLKLKNKLVYYNCSNFTNYESEKSIYVFSDKQQEPNIFLKNITYNNNLVLLKLNIYSGNISNDVLLVSLLNITNTSNTFLINNPYSDYNLSIPISTYCTSNNNYTVYAKYNYLELYNSILITSNCSSNKINNTINTLINNIIFSSQNITNKNITNYDTTNIKLNNSNEDIKNKYNVSIESLSPIYNAIDNINGNSIYESSTIKAGKLSIYGLLFIIGIFIIVTLLPDKLTRKWYSPQEQL